MIDLRHPLAVLATRLPWSTIEAAVAPKLAHQAKPAKRVAGVDPTGAFDGEFGGGISPAGRPMRISVIADARFSLIVDGQTASSSARRGGAQVPVSNVAQPSTISLKRRLCDGASGLVLGWD